MQTAGLGVVVAELGWIAGGHLRDVLSVDPCIGYVLEKQSPADVQLHRLQAGRVRLISAHLRDEQTATKPSL